MFLVFRSLNRTFGLRPKVLRSGKKTKTTYFVLLSARLIVPLQKRIDNDENIEIIDNPDTPDPEEEEEEDKPIVIHNDDGCRLSVGAASGFVSSLTLVGALLIVLNKKRNK